MLSNPCMCGRISAGQDARLYGRPEARHYDRGRIQRQAAGPARLTEGHSPLDSSYAISELF